MGKGDRWSKQGKIWRGTTGKFRPKTWKGKGAKANSSGQSDKKKTQAGKGFE